MKDLHVQYDEVSKNVSSSAFTMLTFSAYFLIALSATDAELFERNWRIDLPIFTATVDFTYFVIAVPLITIGLFFYVHSFIRYATRLASQMQQAENSSGFAPYPTVFNIEETFPRIASVGLVYFSPIVVLVAVATRAHVLERHIFLATAFLSTVGSAMIVNRLLRQHFAEGITPRIRKMSTAAAALVGIVAVAVFGFRSGSEFRFNLQDAHLSGRNLYGRNLSHYDFSNSILEGARLQQSDLVGSKFYHAKAAKADLSGATMQNGSFEYADLSHARLTGIRFTNVALQDSNLSYANLESAVVQRGSFRRANLSHARLRLARFSNANFERSMLVYANASETGFGLKAVMTGARLLGANFSGAVLKRADLYGAKLRADFSWASMQGANLTSADALGAKMVGTKLADANLYNITLEQAVLIRADLRGANLSKAGMVKAILHGANLEKASLIDARLADADLTAINANEFDWANHRYGGVEQLRYPVQQYVGPLDPANIKGADFTGANLEGAHVCGVDFTGVTLKDANVGGVDFRYARNLTVPQLLNARGDSKTQFPVEFTRQQREQVRTKWKSQGVSPCS